MPQALRNVKKKKRERRKKRKIFWYDNKVLLMNSEWRTNDYMVIIHLFLVFLLKVVYLHLCLVQGLPSIKPVLQYTKFCTCSAFKSNPSIDFISEEAQTPL
jgi:hypothetical protein